MVLRLAGQPAGNFAVSPGHISPLETRRPVRTPAVGPVRRGRNCASALPIRASKLETGRVRKAGLFEPHVVGTALRSKEALPRPRKEAIEISLPFADVHEQN